MSAQTTCIAILQSLQDCAPFLMPERSLFADSSNRLPEPITLTEFRSALQELEAKRRILSHRDEDHNLKWKITDNGSARLAELV